MKLTILSLAIFAVVGASMAIPPKNFKNRHVGTPQIQKRAKIKMPNQNKGHQGIHRLDNEGYIPGVGTPPGHG